MKNIIIVTIVSALVLLGCKEYDPAISVSDSSPVFSATEILDLKGYSIFNDAVNHAGVASELYPGDSVTIFVPTNAAFSVLFAELGVSVVTEVDATTLANILRYHTVSGAIGADDISETMSTLLTGKSLYRSTDSDDDEDAGGDGLNGKASFNGDVMYSNDGILHGITSVLEIPSNTIMDILNASPRHTDLVTELVRSGLDVQLGDPNSTFTILAPDSTAIQTANIAALTAADAATALSFHVFGDRTYSMELTDGRKATILGTQADQQQELNIAGLEINGLIIDSTNYSADNGVVHWISDALSEEVENIAFIPADFALVIDALDASVRTFYENINNDYSFMAPDAGAPTVASFGGDTDAMQDWLDTYTFDGELDLRNTDSGTKITSRNGSNYYTNHTSTDIGSSGFTINNQSLLSAASQETYNGFRNRFFASGYPTPLPETTISETLAANPSYDLIAKAIEVAGKESLVDAEGTTFYAIDDALFTALYAYTSATDMDTLSFSDENDEDVLADFVALIDAHTVSGAVESQLILDTDLPAQTSAVEDADEDIIWGLVDGNTVIVTDITDAQNNFVSPTVFDIWASNGVVHVLDGTLD